MIDLFGWRAKAQLETARAQYKEQVDELLDGVEKTLNENANLRQIIRNTDQAIYNITQCTDFAAMRPYILELQSGMESRKRAESNRIGNVIEAELRKAY